MQVATLPAREKRSKTKDKQKKLAKKTVLSKLKIKEAKVVKTKKVLTEPLHQPCVSMKHHSSTEVSWLGCYSLTLSRGPRMVFGRVHVSYLP